MQQWVSIPSLNTPGHKAACLSLSTAVAQPKAVTVHPHPTLPKNQALVAWAARPSQSLPQDKSH